MPDTAERFLYDLGGWPDEAVDRRRRERLDAPPETSTEDTP